MPELNSKLAAFVLLLTGMVTTVCAQDQFTYDDLGRLIRVDLEDGHSVAYSYDPAGNRKQVVIQNNASVAPDSASVPEDGNVDIDVLNNDTGFIWENASITSVSVASNGAAQVTDVSGTDWITYTPNAGYSGADSFSYTLSDGFSSQSTTVSITVIAQNDPPIAVNDTINVDEDSNIVANLRANDSDPEGQPLTIISVSGASNGVVTVINSGTQIRYTPNANYHGSDSFTYVVSDGVLTDNASVTVNVASINDTPTATNDTISLSEDTAKTIDPRSNDSDLDGGSILVTGKTNGSKGNVSITGGGTGVRYTAHANKNGSDSFSYTISDGQGGNATASVSVSIAAVADPPNAVNDSQSTNEDTAKTFNPRGNDTDPDGQTLTIVGKTNGSKGDVAIVSGGASLRYTPHANNNGSDSFTYTVSDGSQTDTAIVSMNINAVNDPPNAVNDYYYNVNKNNWTTLNVLVNDSDPVEGHNVTIVSAFADFGTLQIINGGTALRFRHLGNNPSSVLNYTISDGHGGSDSANIFMTYSGGNNLPDF